WTMTTDMNDARRFHRASILLNGQRLVTGGYYSIRGDSFLRSAELYDPSTSTWTTKANMNAARVRHTASVLSNGTILVAGGSSVYTYPYSAELYDPSTNNWTMTPNMNAARSGHTASVLSNGKILVTGGSNIDSDSNEYLSSAELYDPLT
ncbi:unnamed protein product, partial [Adineta ricciae]